MRFNMLAAFSLVRTCCLAITMFSDLRDAVCVSVALLPVETLQHIAFVRLVTSVLPFLSSDYDFLSFACASTGFAASPHHAGRNTRRHVAADGVPIFYGNVCVLVCFADGSLVLVPLPWYLLQNTWRLRWFGRSILWIIYPCICLSDSSRHCAHNASNSSRRLVTRDRHAHLSRHHLVSWFSLPVLPVHRSYLLLLPCFTCGAMPAIRAIARRGMTAWIVTLHTHALLL
jgi:hypothetical protein